MPYLSKSNIVNGNVIQASDVSQIVDALSYSGSYDLVISGSVSVGTGSKHSTFKLFTVGDVGVYGNISGSSVTASFSGNGQSITGIVSSSYSVTSSFSNTASYSISSSLAVSSSRSTTSSYALNANTSSYAATASYALNATSGGGGGTLSGSGAPGRHAVWVNTTSYLTGSSFISESLSAVYFTGPVYIQGTGSISAPLISTSTYSGSSAIFNSVTSSIFIQTSSLGNIALSNGSGSFTGTITATALYQSSLRVLKENIKPFVENAIDVINSVDVVSFNYKKHPGQYKIGFIADDTHKYLSTDGHNVMDVNNSIGLLLKAVQELHKENLELKSRIIKLEKNN